MLKRWHVSDFGWRTTAITPRLLHRFREGDQHLNVRIATKYTADQYREKFYRPDLVELAFGKPFGARFPWCG